MGERDLAGGAVWLREVARVRAAAERVLTTETRVRTIGELAEDMADEVERLRAALEVPHG